MGKFSESFSNLRGKLSYWASRLGKTKLIALFSAISVILVGVIIAITVVCLRPDGAKKNPSNTVVSSVEIVGATGLSGVVGEKPDVSGITIVFVDNGVKRIVELSEEMIILPSSGIDSVSGLSSDGYFVTSGNKSITVVCENKEFVLEFVVADNFVFAISVNQLGGKAFSEDSLISDILSESGLSANAKYSASNTWKSLDVSNLSVVSATDASGNSVISSDHLGNKFFTKTDNNVYSQEITIVLKYVGNRVPSDPSQSGGVTCSISASLQNDDVKDMEIIWNSDQVSASSFFESSTSKRDFAKMIHAMDVSAVRNSGSKLISSFSDKKYLFSIVEYQTGKFGYSFILDNNFVQAFDDYRKDSFWIESSTGVVVQPFGDSYSVITDVFDEENWFVPSSATIVAVVNNSAVFVPSSNSTLWFFEECVNNTLRKDLFFVKNSYESRSADTFVFASNVNSSIRAGDLDSDLDSSLVFSYDYISLVDSNGVTRLVRADQKQTILNALSGKTINTIIRFVQNFGFKLKSGDDFENDESFYVYYSNGEYFVDQELTISLASLDITPNVTSITEFWIVGQSAQPVFSIRTMYFASSSKPASLGSLSVSLFDGETGIPCNLICASSTLGEMFKQVTVKAYDSQKSLNVSVLPDVAVSFEVVSKPVNSSFDLYSDSAKSQIGIANCNDFYFVGDTFDISSISVDVTLASGDIVHYVNGEYVVFGNSRTDASAFSVIQNSVFADTSVFGDFSELKIASVGNVQIDFEYAGEFDLDLYDIDLQNNSFDISVLNDKVLSISFVGDKNWISDLNSIAHSFDNNMRTALSNLVDNVSLFSRNDTIDVSDIVWAFSNDSVRQIFHDYDMNGKTLVQVDFSSMDFSDDSLGEDIELTLYFKTLCFDVLSELSIFDSIHLFVIENGIIDNSVQRNKYFRPISTSDGMFVFDGEQIGFSGLSIFDARLVHGANILASTDSQFQILNANGIILSVLGISELFNLDTSDSYFSSENGNEFIIRIFNGSAESGVLIADIKLEISDSKFVDVSFVDTTNSTLFVSHFYKGQLYVLSDFYNMKVLLTLNNTETLTGYFNDSTTGILKFANQQNNVDLADLASTVSSFDVPFVYYDEDFSVDFASETSMTDSLSILVYNKMNNLSSITTSNSAMSSEEFLDAEFVGTEFSSLPKFYKTGSTPEKQDKYNSLLNYLNAENSLARNLQRISGFGTATLQSALNSSFELASLDILNDVNGYYVIVGSPAIKYYVDLSFVQKVNLNISAVAETTGGFFITFKTSGNVSKKVFIPSDGFSKIWFGGVAFDIKVVNNSSQFVLYFKYVDENSQEVISSEIFDGSDVVFQKLVNRISIDGAQFLIDTYSGKFNMFSFSLFSSEIGTMYVSNPDDLVNTIFDYANKSSNNIHISLNINYEIFVDGLLSSCSSHIDLFFAEVPDISVSEPIVSTSLGNNSVFLNQVLSLGEQTSDFSSAVVSGLGISLQNYLVTCLNFNISLSIGSHSLTFESTFDEVFSDASIDNRCFYFRSGNGYSVSSDRQFVQFLRTGNVALNFVFAGTEFSVAIMVFDDRIVSASISNDLSIVDGADPIVSGLFAISAEISWASGRFNDRVSFNTNGVVQRDTLIDKLTLSVVSGTNSCLASTFNFGIAFGMTTTGVNASRMFNIFGKSFALRVDYDIAGFSIDGTAKSITFKKPVVLSTDLTSVPSTAFCSVGELGYNQYFNFDHIKFVLSNGMVIETSDFDVLSNNIFFDWFVVMDNSSFEVSVANALETGKMALFEFVISKSNIINADLCLLFDELQIDGKSRSISVLMFSEPKSNVLVSLSLKNAFDNTAILVNFVVNVVNADISITKNTTVALTRNVLLNAYSLQNLGLVLTVNFEDGITAILPWSLVKFASNSFATAYANGQAFLVNEEVGISGNLKIVVFGQEFDVYCY